MKFRSLISAVALITTTSVVNAQTIYTWTGAGSQLDLETNWSPAGGPPSSFEGDTAVFDASGTTKTGLTPNGIAFSVTNLQFTGATYAFATAGGGDTIGIDGTLSLSSAANVNFSDQQIIIGQSMTWSLSGNSSFTGGIVNASNRTLDLGFTSAQQNIARFGSLNLGTSGNLTISNWGGSLGVFGGANNQLRFNSDPTALLSKISFSGYSGSTAATQNMGAYWEVVAVPEPSTWLLIGLGLSVVIVFRRRKSA